MNYAIIGFGKIGQALAKAFARHGIEVSVATTRHDGAATEIGVIAEKLGFSPIKLGGLSDGGLLVQARGKSWGPLIFKDLIKFG
jgi:predicted dinucleotide-binding enzyme